MTAQTRSIIWLNGEDQFCLAKVGLILDLEEKCKAGISEIAGRLEGGTWYLNDVRETIRLGLIGGGKTPERAMAAVRRHVDENPLGVHVLLAYEILKTTIFGVPDDPVGKGTPAEAKDTGSTTTTDASDAPQSSVSAPASAGHQA